MNLKSMAYVMRAGVLYFGHFLGAPPTITAVRRTIAIKGVFDNYKGRPFPLRGGSPFPFRGHRFPLRGDPFPLRASVICLIVGRGQGSTVSLRKCRTPACVRHTVFVIFGLPYDKMQSSYLPKVRVHSIPKDARHLQSSTQVLPRNKRSLQTRIVCVANLQ